MYAVTSPSTFVVILPLHNKQDSGHINGRSLGPFACCPAWLSAQDKICPQWGREKRQIPLCGLYGNVNHLDFILYLSYFYFRKYMKLNRQKMVSLPAVFVDMMLVYKLLWMVL